MRETFIRRLEKMNFALIEMGGMCEQAIGMSIEAMSNHTDNSTNKIISYDKEINRKEREIENMCIDLIQTQQPVARDLRLISSALRIITDMERIGDQAADIAEIVQRGNLRLETDNPVVNMGNEALKMLNESIDSFVKMDREKAEAVIAYDDVVDNCFEGIKGNMLKELKKNPNNTEYVIDMLMISKYLERIADHAVNIAEWTIYIQTGRHNSEG